MTLPTLILGQYSLENYCKSLRKGPAREELILVLQYLGYELRELKNDQKNALRLEWLYKKILTEISGSVKNLDQVLDGMRRM